MKSEVCAGNKLKINGEILIVKAFNEFVFKMLQPKGHDLFIDNINI